LFCSNASAEEVVSPSALPVNGSNAAVGEREQTCPAGLRLRAVQFDPNHDERSFVVLAGSPLRAAPLRRGARVGSYAIERIERGAAVLVTATQRCSLRLRGAQVDRELRAISVEAVRGGLRARAAAAGRSLAISGSSRNRARLVAAR
jgi:hypothetical protein